MRVAAINRTRGCAARIFNLRDQLVQRVSRGIDKQTEPLLMRFLRWSQTDVDAGAHEDFPPILYPNCVHNSLLVFRNPQLVEVCTPAYALCRT